METKYQPFVAYLPEDVSSEAPRLTFDMKPYQPNPEELSLTLPYRLLVTLRRPSDDIGQSCIFRWSPNNNLFWSAEMVLLHLTGDGPQRIQVEPQAPVDPDYDTIDEFNGWNKHIEELRPGGEVNILASVTMNYQKLLKLGEKYALVYPGNEIDMWEWGTKFDHVGKSLKIQRLKGSAAQPNIIIPGNKAISFTVMEEQVPWPDRPETKTDSECYMANVREEEWRQEQRQKQNPPPSPPLIDSSQRLAGAPILHMEIECPLEWSSDAVVKLQVKVTYDALPDEQNARPVTFHTSSLSAIKALDKNVIQLYQFVNEEWKAVRRDDNGCRFALYDDPPITVSVGDVGHRHADQFATLRPGETWTFECMVQNGTSWTELPEDVKVGDKFKYIAKGVVVDWWDWGTREDHIDTVVKIPAWIMGDVVDPADNNGRQKLVISASNEAISSFVG